MNKTNYIVKVALLSVIAFVLTIFEFPIPFFPSFLKMGFGDLPALIGGFSLGPMAGVWIELLKNVFNFILKNDGTGGVGNLSNFLVGISFVLPASIIYIRNKNRKNAIIGIVIGIICMVVVGSFTNYFIIIPLYQKILPLDAIIAMAAKANPSIGDMKTYITYAVIPFNFIKALINSIITLIIYKKISPILHG